MALLYPDIISAETFPHAWNYAAGKLRYAKRGYIIENLVNPIAHLTFLVLALFFGCGMVYSHLEVDGLKAFFQRVPAFVDAWMAFQEKAFTAFSFPAFAPALVWEAGICILIALVIPAAQILVLAGIVYLVYRPRYPAMPDAENEAESACALHALIRQIRQCGRKRRLQVSWVTGVLFMLFGFALMAIFVMGRLDTDLSAITEFLSNSVLILLLVFGIYIGYSLINYPLVLLVNLLCQSKVPAPFAVKAENYLKSILPPEEAEAVLNAPLPTRQKLIPRFKAAVAAAIPRPAFVEKLLDNPWGFPIPLDAESLPHAWKWASRKLYWTKKKKAIASVTAFTTWPYFAAVLLVLVYGVLYELNNPVLAQFFGNWSVLSQLWEKIQPILYANAATAAQQNAVRLQVLYLVPLALSAAAALAVVLLYHPRSRRMEASASEEGRAEELLSLLREAKQLASPGPSNLRGFCHCAFSCLGLMFVVMFVVMFVPFLSFETNVPPAELSQIYGKVVWAVLGFTLGYWLASLPLSLVLKLMSFRFIPRRAVAEAEHWLEQCRKHSEAAPEAFSAEEIPEVPQTPGAEV